MCSPVFALGKMLIAIGLMRNRTGAFEVALSHRLAEAGLYGSTTGN